MIAVLFLSCIALGLASAARIVFPEVDNFPTQCKFPDGTDGTCLNINNCVSALTAKSVATCHFDGPDHYVCCKKNLWTDMKGHRINEGKECDAPPLEIVNGLFTEYKEFPYMAALGWESLFSENPYDYKCGGVLITPTYVLTAAHCAELNGLQPSAVLVGGTSLVNSTLKPINVSKVIVHPNYQATEAYNDIALLQLETKAMEMPICVWTTYPFDSLNVTAIGYGHTQFAGAGSDNLLKTYLSIVHNYACTANYENESDLPRGVVETQLCAKDMTRGSDTCQGDSGGPLILHSKNSRGSLMPLVVGITSFGRACAMEAPGVYTRVSEYVDWMESVIFA